MREMNKKSKRKIFYHCIYVFILFCSYVFNIYLLVQYILKCLKTV